MQYGATMVYTEETIDKKILTCQRVENSQLGTIDFVNKDKRPCLQVKPGERVVFQLGTADAVTALRAAEMVCRDVRAIDVNMGCPKTFSIQGGCVHVLCFRRLLPAHARGVLFTRVHFTCASLVLMFPVLSYVCVCMVIWCVCGLG